jgi:hypothetical protein
MSGKVIGHQKGGVIQLIKISAHKSARQFHKVSWKIFPESTGIPMVGKKLKIELWEHEDQQSHSIQRD